MAICTHKSDSSHSYSSPLREMLAIYIQGMILKQNAFRLLHSINCNFFSPDEFKNNEKSYIPIPHYCISVSYRYMYAFLLTMHIVAPAHVSNLDIFCSCKCNCIAAIAHANIIPLHSHLIPHSNIVTSY